MNERIAHPLTVDPAAYDTDVHAWALAQAAFLRARRFEAIDLHNIVEEIESLGNEQAHAVQSHLIVLVEHLLKLSVSGDREPRRLLATSVRNARNRIAIRLRRTPACDRSLPNFLPTAGKLRATTPPVGFVSKRRGAYRATCRLRSPK